MKVRDLIEKLQEQDPDLEAVINTGDNSPYKIASVYTDDQYGEVNVEVDYG